MTLCLTACGLNDGSDAGGEAASRSEKATTKQLVDPSGNTQTSDAASSAMAASGQGVTENDRVVARSAILPSAAGDLAGDSQSMAHDPLSSGISPETTAQAEAAAHDTSGENAQASGDMSTAAPAIDTDFSPAPPSWTDLSGTSPLCASVLSGAPPLTSGTDVGAMPATPRPATGVATEDPTWHSCMVRLTQQAETHPEHPRYTPHSAQQAFNADDSAALLRTNHGEWHILDPRTGQYLRKLEHIQGNAEPQWDPHDPRVLYYLNDDGEGMKILRLTIDLSPNGTDRTEQVADMSAEVKKRWPDATHVRMRGGTPSDDGSTWCFMAGKQEGETWTGRGLFTWDLRNGQIIGTLGSLPGRLEYVTTSPSGSHCVAQYTYLNGVHAYKRDFSAPYNAKTPGNSLKVLGRAYQQYGDVARNAQGQDMYVGFDVYSDPHHLFMTNLTTGEKTTLLTTSFGLNTDTGVQVSGRAMQRPGWVLVSGFGERKRGVNNLKEDDPDRKWFHRKMFAFSLENPPKVLSIANLHHLWDSNQNATWPRPQGTVNRSFTRMMFNSTWDSMNVQDLDTYLVEILPNAVPPLSGETH